MFYSRQPEYQDVIMTAPSPPVQTATCFIFLQPKDQTQSSIIELDSAAGLAFNRALRSVAELDTFSARPYGADGRGCSYQLFGWTQARQPTEAPRFVWVINWLDVASMESWSSSGNRHKTMGILSEYFKPDVTNVLLVRWNAGDAAKMLNRTNDMHQLSVSKEELSPLNSKDRSSQEDEALGAATFAPCGKVQDVFSATLRSFNKDTKNDSTHTEYSYAFTLTRTKYCTRIRQDLQAAINSRRSE